MQNTSDFGDLPPTRIASLGSRTRTSLRLNYEAQAKVVQNQIGDLEMVRLKLGLSARRICQLMLVDPSAWSRWTRSDKGGGAPPHIWRALQWYLILQEKIPGLTPEYFLGKNSVVQSLDLKRDFDLKYQSLEKVQESWTRDQSTQLQKVQLELSLALQDKESHFKKIDRLQRKIRQLVLIQFIFAALLLVMMALTIGGYFWSRPI